MQKTQAQDQLPPQHETISYRALIGIDWGDKSHHLQVHDSEAGRVVDMRKLSSNPKDVHQWIQQLREQFTEGRIAVCLEMARGALLHELACYEFIDIYPVNPATSARYRLAFKPSGAKDDMPDAGVCLNLLLHHRSKIRLWKPSHPVDRQLIQLSERRRNLVQVQVDLRNQLTAELKSYFPQALELAGTDLASRMACRFLQKWGDLNSLKKSRAETIRKFYYAQGCRRGDVIERRIEAIAQARPVTEDRSVIEPAILYVQSLAKQLLMLSESIAAFDNRLKQAYAAHPDHDLWRSFPGAGDIFAPRLAAAWGVDRDRFANVDEMQSYSGIAPVRERSGKKNWVHRRYHRPMFLHQTFWEYAKLSMVYCDWAKAYVDGAKARGMKASTAIRALAFKWQRIMFACWKTNKPYDDALYLRKLKTKGSPYACDLPAKVA